MQKMPHYLSAVLLLLSATPCFSAQLLLTPAPQEVTPDTVIKENDEQDTTCPVHNEATLIANPKLVTTPTSQQVDDQQYAPNSLVEYEVRRKYLERLLPIFQQHYGASYPKTIGIMEKLGIMLYALSQYESAKKYLEDALKINVSNYGKDTPETASLMKNLGRVLYALGEYKRAKKYLEDALKINVSNYGKEQHIEIARTKTYLARVLYALGEYKSAKQYLEESKKIKATTFTLRTLADVLNALHDYTGARKCYKEVFDMYTKKYGVQHTKTREAQKHLLTHDEHYGNKHLTNT